MYQEIFREHTVYCNMPKAQVLLYKLEPANVSKLCTLTSLTKWVHDSQIDSNIVYKT